MSAVAPVPVVPVRASDRRLLTWLFVMNTALLSCYAAFMVIFIPDQVQQLDEENKVGNLALVMTASSIGAIIIHPLVGAFSDRTRSRLGRRAPWMLGSAAVAAVMMVVLSGAPNLLALGVFWVLVMLALNALGTAKEAIVPDRIRKDRLGTASGILAMGTFLGMGLGVAGAGVFLNSIGVGYAVFGTMILVATLLFVVCNRDFSSKQLERRPFSWRSFSAAFAVNPRRYPDFWWAFAGRFLMILAYQSVQSYLLYILRDYIHLGDAESAALSTPLTAVMLLGALATAFLTGKISDRIGRRKPFVIVASVVMAGSLVIPLVSPSIVGMFGLAAVFGLGYGVYLSVDTALMNQVLPQQPGAEDDGVLNADAAAKDLGILNVATTLPQALTPVVVWALIAITGSYVAVFVAGIFFALLGALSVLPIRSVR
jgi:MFS family permease